MRLSELTTDEALDVLCQITPYVTNIVTDDDVMKTIGKAVKTDDVTQAGLMLLGMEKLTSIANILLKTHRTDVYGIVAAVNRVDAEVVASQNVIKTMVQIREICKDKDLLDFFRSWGQQEKTA